MYIEKAILCGMNQVLSKPVPIQTLKQLLRKLDFIKDAGPSNMKRTITPGSHSKPSAQSREREYQMHPGKEYKQGTKTSTLEIQAVSLTSRVESNKKINSSSN